MRLAYEFRAVKKAGPLLLFLCLGAVSTAQLTVIKAGRLIDADQGTVSTDQVIVIRGNKFEAVGKNIAIPPNATVIDLSKKSMVE